jgi:predicted amidohydrolase
MLLLIPGTIYWRDKSGGVHNSISAFAGGQVIGSYDKKNWTGVEESAANAFGKPVKGTLPYATFPWNGLQVGCQICQDSADPLNPKPDIHVVAGANAGLVTERHRDGGVFVYSDSIGLGRATDTFRKQSFDKSQAVNPAVLTLAWP